MFLFVDPQSTTYSGMKMKQSSCRKPVPSCSAVRLVFVNLITAASLIFIFLPESRAENSQTTVPQSAQDVPTGENAYCGKGDVARFGDKDGPAELPKRCYYTAIDGTPAPGKTIPVRRGTDLAKAVDQAKCGDTLLLAAGEVFRINEFPSNHCDDQHYIVIRTDTPDEKLPREGERISPAWAGVGSLPGRPSYSQPTGGPAKLMPTILVTTPEGVTFGDHYRFIGIEWTKEPGSRIGRLILTAEGNHLIFDRNWIHGIDGEELGHGVGTNRGATYIAVINSYLNSITCTAKTGSCTDATAVGGGNGELPSFAIKIVNNFLEASGENVMFGGAHATIRPEDIEIRRNHMFKPMFWNPGHPSHREPTPIVKNLFELKNANRVLLEGNFLENSWGGFSQVGAAILLTPRNQANKRLQMNMCPICAVTNVTVRYSWIRRVNQAFQIANPADLGAFASGGNSYSFHDIIVDGIGYPECTKGCGGATNLLGGGKVDAPPADIMHNVSIDHVTFVSMKDRVAFIILSGPPVNNPKAGHMYNISWTNTIGDAGQYGLRPTGGGADLNCSVLPRPSPKQRLDACWGSGSKFVGNVLAGGKFTRPSGDWPEGNLFAGDQKDIGYVNLNGGIGGDYHLAPSSKFKGKATDGRDPGADVDAVLSAIAGVQ